MKTFESTREGCRNNQERPKWWYGRLKNVLQKIQVTIPRTCGCYLIWRGKDFVERIKNHEMRDCLGLVRCAMNMATDVLQGDRQREIWRRRQGEGQVKTVAEAGRGEAQNLP